MAKKKGVELAQLKPIQIINNSGQLEGLPKNPRLIKDENFEALKKSISECKIMTEIREVVVYPFNENYIVIAGNMRFRAMEELKFKTVPCKILPESTPVKVLREIAIKDNNHNGENDWDVISSEWDNSELNDWGLEVFVEEDVDYSILDDEDLEEQLTTMTKGVKKAIQIEFEHDHYNTAAELIRFFRDEKLYIGGFLIKKLKEEKEKL
jgi:hypothetical protein